jgi:dCMP deaminase
MNNENTNTIESTLSWDEYFMRVTYLTTDKSKDPSSKVGAILVADNNVFSTGFNGFPRGIQDTHERLHDRETKYKYVCHAEANSIYNAARLGRPTLGSTMYTIGVPCTECAKAIIQAGVKEVVVHADASVNFKHGKWAESCALTLSLFEEAGISLRFFDKKLGIKTLVNKEWKEV